MRMKTKKNFSTFKISMLLVLRMSRNRKDRQKGNAQQQRCLFDVFYHGLIELN